MLRAVSLLIGFFLFLSLCLKAQEPLVKTNSYNLFSDAEDLFHKKKYGVAREKFSLYATNFCNSKQPNKRLCIDAEFYASLCSLFLFNDNSEGQALNFMKKYPSDIKSLELIYHLGDYKFRAKKYKDALTYYNQVDMSKLDKEKQSEVNFKKGYCMYKTSDSKNASLSLFQVKDTNSKYFELATYYYAHIAYENGKNQTALKKFKKIAKSERFKAIVPYYIAQIYYRQEKYKELLKIASELIDEEKESESLNLLKVLGDASFKLKDYDLTIKYLERIKKIDKNKLLDKTTYQLGYAYFKKEKYEEAAAHLKKATRSDSNDIKQAAYYYLSISYLKMDKKRYAQSTFRLASKLDAHEDMKKDALFKYSQLAYELSNQPFNDAIEGFHKFIEEYPSDSRINKANDYLVGAYYSSKNYGAALNSLSKISPLDYKQKKIFQKITHYYGIELFNQKSYLEAVVYFQKSKEEPIDLNIDAYNDYWTGESYYRIKDYEKAAASYKKSLFNVNTPKLSIYKLVNYHLGYAYFRAENFTEAIKWFRKYIDLSKEEVPHTNMVTDALTRVGDAYYMEKEYYLATNFYEKASSYSSFNKDYTLYQSAICYGIQKKYEDKKALLKTILHSKEKSNYKDDALFSLAATNMNTNNNKTAITLFKQFLKTYPKSIYYKKALSKLGLIYFNDKNDDEALKYFEELFEKYSSSKESIESLEFIKRIYKEKSDLVNFQKFMEKHDVPDSLNIISEIDYYDVAEKYLYDKEYSKATKAFTDYIEKYGNGVNVIKSYYKRGVSQLEQNFYEEALSDFKKVINTAKNDFTEDALLMAATANKEIGDKTEELNIYSKIIALSEIKENVDLATLRLMKLKFELKQFDDILPLCDSVIIESNRKKDYLSTSEAIMIKAKVMAAKGDTDQAIAYYRAMQELESNNIVAQASYLIAKHLSDQKEYKESIKQVFTTIENHSGADLWVNESLLLLAKNYVAIKDTFEAKVTLNNIIEKSAFSKIVKESVDILTTLESKNNKKEEGAEEEVRENYLIEPKNETE